MQNLKGRSDDAREGTLLWGTTNFVSLIQTLSQTSKKKCDPTIHFVKLNAYTALEKLKLIGHRLISEQTKYDMLCIF